MTRKKCVYSAEFKTQAISLVRDAGRPAVKVSSELGINVNTLYNWLNSSSKSGSKKGSVAPTN